MKKYFDYDSYELKIYECEEDAVKDGLCIFHHETYWKESKDDVREKFMEKVEDAIKNKKPLLCIGYNLPAVDLSNKRFEVPVYFKDTVFHEGVNFYSVEFNREADFREVRFSLANFISATFSEADFRRATFSELAVFEEVKFLGKALFDSATFLDTVSFVNPDFSPGILEKSLDPYSCISFRNSNFEKQEKVVFIGCNMERVSFINTNIERVRFKNVEWGDFRIYDEKLLLLKESKEEREKFIEDGKRKLTEISNVSKERILEILIGKSKANKIEEEIVKVLELRIPYVLEEIKELIEKEKTKDKEDRLNQLLKECENEVDKIIKEVENAIKMSNEEIEKRILENVENDKDLALDHVLAVYRALRENYDYYLKYDESGKFFINEMKLKKRFSNFTEKIVLSIYELLCLYGESYRRTIVWILATILLFALARFLFEASPFIDSLKISIAAFFQLYYNNDPLTIMERVVSIPILGTFIIALRRKLERRIRH
jgi:hypothetical protein